MRHGVLVEKRRSVKPEKVEMRVLRAESESGKSENIAGIRLYLNMSSVYWLSKGVERLPHQP